MRKSSTLLIGAAVLAATLSGCASQSSRSAEEENALMNRISAAERSAAEAKQLAAEARQAAAAAQARADEAMAAAQANDTKVDRAFRKSQQK